MVTLCLKHNLYLKNVSATDKQIIIFMLQSIYVINITTLSVIGVIRYSSQAKSVMLCLKHAKIPCLCTDSYFHSLNITVQLILLAVDDGLIQDIKENNNAVQSWTAGRHFTGMCSLCSAFLASSQRYRLPRSPGSLPLSPELPFCLCSFGSHCSVC